MAQESAQESSQGGHLVIIGGGLRPNNEEVFLRMIDYAGGVDRARFVILPTASSSDRYSREFCKELERYGIPADRAEILDVMDQRQTFICQITITQLFHKKLPNL